MSTIPFTDRAFKRAWRNLSLTAGPEGGRQNIHRLLLFYAVECGLKAVWLKRRCRTLFDQDDIDQTGHDLRKILKDLGVGTSFSLPVNLQLSPVNRGGQSIPRNGTISILHQAWRYGGLCCSPSDQDCETALQDVLHWINKELT